eukprot:11747723-Heterocapsa_arctica.AAC.1
MSPEKVVDGPLRKKRWTRPNIWEPCGSWALGQMSEISDVLLRAGPSTPSLLLFDDLEFLVVRAT